MVASMDSLSFEDLYGDQYEAVLRYCVRRAGHEEALDATAETFTIAWRRRADLPWDRPLPWLYGVARRVLANQRRTQTRFRRTVTRIAVNSVAAEPAPETLLVHRAEAVEVEDALSQLRPSDREVIRLAAWEQLTREGLGVALGCSTNAATKRLGRALDRLAKELGATRSVGLRFINRERKRA
jgi:RNA polymerase sigma-70 factor (ECF subfamily)